MTTRTGIARRTHRMRWMNLLVTLCTRDCWTLARVRLMTIGAFGMGWFNCRLGQYGAIVVTTSASFDLSFSKPMCQVARATGFVPIGKNSARGNKRHTLVTF